MFIFWFVDFSATAVAFLGMISVHKWLTLEKNKSMNQDEGSYQFILSMPYCALQLANQWILIVYWLLWDSVASFSGLWSSDVE